MVGSEVASGLRAPLGAVLTRRLTAPDHPQTAIGAIGEGGVRIVDALAMRLLRVSAEQLCRIETVEQAELQRCLSIYRNGRPLPHLTGRHVILVDDGLASGLTARAALEVIRPQRPARVILAVPVTGPNAAAAALGWADDVVCVAVPPGFAFVSEWYQDYDDALSHYEVVKLLQQVDGRASDVAFGAEAPEGTPSVNSITSWEADTADLRFPTAQARAIVLIAHGAGSHRHSPRNRLAAELFRAAGLATLQFDLLTPSERAEEAESRHLRFNIGLLTERIESMLDWLSRQNTTQRLPVVGYGASTGAAAILAAAARNPGTISAIVSRGGRPDYVEPLLPRVAAPTLLLVGDQDTPTLGLNRSALARIGSSDKTLSIVRAANHLFDDPTAMTEAAELARNWIMSRLPTLEPGI